MEFFSFKCVKNNFEADVENPRTMGSVQPGSVKFGDCTEKLTWQKRGADKKTRSMWGRSGEGQGGTREFTLKRPGTRFLIRLCGNNFLSELVTTHGHKPAESQDLEMKAPHPPFLSAWTVDSPASFLICVTNRLVEPCVLWGPGFPGKCLSHGVWACCVGWRWKCYSSMTTPSTTPHNSSASDSQSLTSPILKYFKLCNLTCMWFTSKIFRNEIQTSMLNKSHLSLTITTFIGSQQIQAITNAVIFSELFISLWLSAYANSCLLRAPKSWHCLLMPEDLAVMLFYPFNLPPACPGACIV